MTDVIRDAFSAATPDRTAASFSAPLEHDGVVVITATSSRVPTVSTNTGKPGFHAEMSGSHPIGAFVVKGGRVRWRPAVDVTRLLTTAEVVVGAVLVAHRLSRRPSAAKAQVSMGPGGWVSMKGGTVALRPGSRFWRRPRPLPTKGKARRPVWARLLSAVPQQSLRG